MARFQDALVWIVGGAAILVLSACTTTDGYHTYNYSPEYEAALEKRQMDENQQAWDQQFYKQLDSQQHAK